MADLDAVLASLRELEAAGALGGVAAVAAERVRQVRLGWTPEHDRAEHGNDAWLPREARKRLSPGWYDRHALAESAALAAAEIDRLTAEGQDHG